MQNKYAENSVLIEDEELIIATSGEMPEVALHGSLYYLCEDTTGPKLILSKNQRLRLKQAVIIGYRTIILRDLLLSNRDKGIYRGVARSVINWQRLVAYCAAEEFDTQQVGEDVREALFQFVTGECDDAKRGYRKSCINCSQNTVKKFMKAVGLKQDLLPEGWKNLF